MKLFRNAYAFSASLIQYLTRLGRFAVIVFGFYLLYDLLLEQTLDGSNEIIPLLGLWLISAYITLPRIHRFLTKFYLPNYFVGRVRSPSGLLSDPVNLAFFGTEKQLKTAFKRAGWVEADRLTPQTYLKAVYCSIFRKSYPAAPVGDMFLFSRRYDFAFQQEVDGNPNQRHHLRFWSTPKKWYLPGGYKADWLAAASYDTHVGIKLATLQIDHMIHGDIDGERDYIIKTLQDASAIKKLTIVKHFTDAFRDRSNGGDSIETDGSLPFIGLT